MTDSAEIIREASAFLTMEAASLAANTAVAMPGEVMEADLNARSAPLAEYVPVIFASRESSATKIKDFLEESGIPTLVEFNGCCTSSLVRQRRIPVLVPDDMQDEASELVARLEADEVVHAGDDDDVFDDDDEDFDEDELADSQDDDDVFDDENERDL